jgi:hypothetical protein
MTEDAVDRGFLTLAPRASGQLLLTGQTPRTEACRERDRAVVDCQRETAGGMLAQSWVQALEIAGIANGGS